MALYRVWLIDCNLEPSSGAIFEAAIRRWAPADVALQRVRIPDTDGASWAQELAPCHGLIVSGSSAALQSGPPWVAPLANSLREVTSKGIPTLGICFGHQVLAYAWGGQIEEDRLGYKIRGITTIDTRPPDAESHEHSGFKTNAALLFGSGETTVEALSSHRDQVVAAPPGWGVLASSEQCPIQALCAPSLPIVTVQWHPEADAAFIIENPNPEWDHLADPGQRDLKQLSGNSVLQRFFAGVVAHARSPEAQ